MDAVLYMHSKGFVHRDLKPENILLEYNGASNTDFYIKVCDFGLCEKVVQENTVLTGETHQSAQQMAQEKERGLVVMNNLFQSRLVMRLVQMISSCRD